VGYSTQGFRMAVDEAVEHHHGVAGLQQTQGGVTPDVSPAACDQQIGQLFASHP